MNYVNKNDIVKEVAETLGVPRGQAEKVIDQFLANVASAAAQGKQVRLAGFGVFKERYRAPRATPFGSTGQTRGKYSLVFTAYPSACRIED